MEPASPESDFQERSWKNKSQFDLIIIVFDHPITQNEFEAKTFIRKIMLFKIMSDLLDLMQGHYVSSFYSKSTLRNFDVYEIWICSKI